MSEAREVVSPDDSAAVAEAIRRAAAGATVSLVRDGRPVADIVPPAREPEPEPDPEYIAELERRLAQRIEHEIEIGMWHARTFGAPTLEHYRRVHEADGQSWPGEAFIRRHYPVADTG